MDLLGHGRSDRATEPGRYALEALVADLCDLLDTAGVEAADWLGYSMGGRLALGAAVLAPDRVRRLVLESASPGLSTEEERSARRISDAGLARRIRAGGIEGFVEEWEAQPLFATQDRLPASLRAEQRRRRLAGDPEALAACLGGLGVGSQPSFWEDLPGVSPPTLIVVGERDPKFLEIGRRMSDQLPSPRLAVIADAGHAVHLEAPAALLSVVTAFLGAG